MVSAVFSSPSNNTLLRALGSALPGEGRTIADIASFSIDVFESDGTTPVTSGTLTKVGEAWEGTLNDLPLGTTLVFNGHAFNTPGLEIFTGSVKTTVAQSGAAVLLPMDAVSVTLSLPRITSMTAPAELQTGVTANIRADIVGSAQLPALDFSFTPDVVPGSGSFSNPSNGGTITLPAANGYKGTVSADYTAPATISTDPATFTHTSPNYPGDHAGNPGCNACHLSGGATVPWPAPSYQPDCAACHATRFTPGPHTKTDNPTILYTVSELRDCSGSCHEYTDSSFTTISRTRSGQHRARDSGW